MATDTKKKKGKGKNKGGPSLIEGRTYKAYCMKCKEKGRKARNPRIKVADNGKVMVQGEHKFCGTTMTSMIGKVDYNA